MPIQPTPIFRIKAKVTKLDANFGRICALEGRSDIGEVIEITIRSADFINQPRLGQEFIVSFTPSDHEPSSSEGFYSDFIEAAK